MNDFKGNLISFSGSINETSAAWEKNGEEFHLFRDWKEVASWKTIFSGKV